MPIRCTLLFAVTTDPQDRQAAAPHSGGWSESFYITGSGFQPPGFFQNWAQWRGALLSGECQIVGYRQQLYTMAGNKLFPGGSASGTLNTPGAFPKDLDVPQAALMINWAVANQPQTIRQRLAGTPDSQVTFGEYQPASTYKTSVTKYINAVLGSFGSVASICAVTHDLTQQEVRVVSLTPIQGTTTATLITSGPTGTLPGGYIRFHRLRDDDGLPVSGSFLVNASVAGQNGQQSYTLAGFKTGQTVSTPNGLARNDVLVSNPLIGGSVSRIVVRKVGRPFQGYRGRRSNRPKV